MTVLRALLDIISSGVAEIEDGYSAASRAPPTLNDPWTPSVVEDQVHQTAERVAAAAFQLMILVRKPTVTLTEASMSMYTSVALNVVDRANIVEILTEAGPKGMHVNDIAAKSGVSPRKLGQLLRLLVARAIFQEVKPDVFANNRLSSALDTGKTLSEIRRAPDEKYTGTNGVMAFVGHTADEIRTASNFLPEILFDPKAGKSEDLTYTALKTAFPKAKDGVFEWLQLPENKLWHKRYSAAMAGTRAFFPEKVILQGFDWSSLAPGSKVVDVGGGVGSTALVLAKEYPQLKVVVQDLPSTIAEAEKYWQAESPKSIASGQVALTVHDFFTPQPIKDAAVFLLRAVTHDWPNNDVKRIFAQLRGAATPQTRLILGEYIVPYASPTSAYSHIPGADEKPVPEPLAPTLVSGWLTTGVSIQMLTKYNAQERTVGEFATLGEETGWKLAKVYRAPLCQLEFTPIGRPNFTSRL